MVLKKQNRGLSMVSIKATQAINKSILERKPIKSVRFLGFQRNQKWQRKEWLVFKE
jgi:hypothetical protein